ncbi:hypothetical protein ACFWNN_15960 [Lentzea sp. NPDC058450]|uniref:hypothetical protein n=1 Tax=Lentzea sp. NPDC058450 TaxID=3346505 RepID=UPI0036569AC9
MGELIVAVTAEVHHGCLFLEDAHVSGLRHDSWDPAAAQYDVEDDSVAFSVQPSVDGPVTVRVWRGEPGPEAAAMPYFSGVLRGVSGRVRLFDADEVVALAFDLPDGPHPFHVLTDSVEHPESVDIVFA